VADAALGLPCESTLVVEAFGPTSCRRRERDLPSVDVRSEPELAARCSDGSTSFFCFDAGRISSRSTGTPRDTRKSRRIRLRIQSGGCSGGGATSCDHNDALLGVRKTGFSLDSRGAGVCVAHSCGGKRIFRYGSVTARISSASRPSKSGIGF
jgi:hypothetical protein